MAGAKKGAALFVLGAAIVLTAAACGGGNSSKSSSPSTTQGAATTTSAATAKPLGKAAYVAKMKAIGSSLSSSLNSLNSATNAAKAATALTAVQTDLRAAADRIDAITPPKPVKTEHAKLEKGVRDFADELTPVIAKLKAGTMSALSAVGTLKGLQEIQTASGAIANKGYKIGG